MCKLLSFFLVLIVAAVLGDIPKSITICHNDDRDCIKKSIQEVFTNHYGGLPELNLIPFDPLRIKSLALERNPKSPVNLELSFKDLDLIGLKTATVKDAKGFNFKERSVFEVVVPQLLLKGDYVVDGNVLILPIKGSGKALITCTNILLRYSFDLKKMEKNGKIYAELEHVKLEIKPEHVHYKFDNLFNGAKELSDNMNVFINDNWLEIFKELEHPVAKGIGLVVKKGVNNVVNNIPYNELFPERA